MLTLESGTRVTLEKMRMEYYELISRETFSLRALLNPEGFSLDEFCKGFSPHPLSEKLCEEVKNFSEQYDIWLEHARNYIDCALYLFPTSPRNRITAIVKNLAIDYYLNDTMGRDVFASLPMQAKLKARETIARIASLNPTLKVNGSLSKVEVANILVLRYLKQSSPSDWFQQFLNLYNLHIEAAHRNNNAQVKGRIPTVDEYIYDRGHMSGMHHVISLIEYSEAAYLDWGWLERNHLAQDLKRIQDVTVAIGGLTNDCFSFEKEVIDNGSDSNLVAVCALNMPDKSLPECVKYATNLVRNLISEFLIGMARLREYTLKPYLENELEAHVLFTHLDGLDRCVQASWAWQNATPRYRRDQSIWAETQHGVLIEA